MMTCAYLTVPLYDINGAVLLWPLPSSDFGDVSRRVNRVATLDGGVVVNDGGFAEGDRTLELRWRYRPDVDAKVAALVKNHSIIHASVAEGCYQTVPQRYRKSGMESSLTLLVTERLDQ